MNYGPHVIGGEKQQREKKKFTCTLPSKKKKKILTTVTINTIVTLRALPSIRLIFAYPGFIFFSFLHSCLSRKTLISEKCNLA